MLGINTANEHRQFGPQANSPKIYDNANSVREAYVHLILSIVQNPNNDIPLHLIFIYSFCLRLQFNI